MYNFLNGLFSDKKTETVFSVFGIWHIVYMLVIFSCIILLVFLLKNKEQNVKEKAINITINLAFGLYIADFFIMPFGYGEIDLEKLPFHICTSTCVLCFLSRHTKFFSKYRKEFVLLGLLGNLTYVIYPAGVGQFLIHPLSYRAFQTLLFHGTMTCYSVFCLSFGDIKLEWRKIYKDLIMICVMVIWAIIGNNLYNGNVGEYNHNFNWFFVIQDPFYLLPKDIAPLIMPFVNIVVFFVADILVYLSYFGIKKLHKK